MDQVSEIRTGCRPKKAFRRIITVVRCTTLRAMRIALLVACFLPSGVFSQRNDRWITAYYPLWSVPSMPPDKLELDGITHIIHFSANPVRTAPYLDVLVPAQHGSFNQDSINIQWGGVYNGNNPPLWSTVNLQQDLIARSHRAGVKVILSVGGIYGVGAESMAWICQDSVRIQTFVRAASRYAKRKGYDGIEIDWEFPRAKDKTGFTSMVRQFRDQLNSWKPRGELIAAVHESTGPYFAYDRDVMVECFDQINLMTYELYAGDFSAMKTGYNTPIHRSTEFPGYNGFAIDQEGHGPKSWINAGYPAFKIGLGISFLTVEFAGVDPPVQPGRTYQHKKWGYLKNVPFEGRHWDTTAFVPWQSSGTTMISYEDPLSIQVKIEYLHSLGLGGVMLYDLLGGFLPNTPRNPHQLLNTVVKEMDRARPQEVRRD